LITILIKLNIIKILISKIIFIINKNYKLVFKLIVTNILDFKVTPKTLVLIISI